MLSSFLFFGNNLILNKASLRIFPCKWSAVAGISDLGDIRLAGLRHMVGGSVSFFSLVRVACFLFLYCFNHRTVKFSSQ